MPHEGRVIGNAQGDIDEEPALASLGLPSRHGDTARAEDALDDGDWFCVAGAFGP